jgi:hypothetical protein
LHHPKSWKKKKKLKERPRDSTKHLPSSVRERFEAFAGVFGVEERKKINPNSARANNGVPMWS